MQLTDNNKTAFAGMLISIATLLAYWQILQNGFVSYDDTRYLFENDHVRSGLSVDGIIWSLTSTYEGNWFPLTWMSHMIDVSIFGYNPLGHHLVNLVLHVMNALLLLWILVRTTGFVWRSAAVAALFALHPLHVESVAWVAERKDVLCMLFFMLTIIAYSHYAARRSVPRYLLVVVLYICGLASKPMLVSLPLVLLLLDFWPLDRLSPETGDPGAGAGGKGHSGDKSSRETIWHLLAEKLPLVALAAASCFLTFAVQKGESGVIDVAHHTLTENAAHAMVNYVSYLSKMFLPVHLAVIYPYVSELPHWQVAGAAVFLLLLSVLAFRQRKTRGYWTLGWFWFLITLGPVIGLVKVGEHSIADRYSYIPLTGLFIALVWAVSDFLKNKPRGRLAATVVTVLLFFVLAGAAWQQTGYWRDSITLFEHTLEVTSDNYVAHTNLGSELMKYGKADKAVWHFRESVRLNPQNPEVYYNLGVALDTLGDLPGAIKALRTVVEMNPALKEAHFYLGTAYARTGNLKAALEENEALERISPDMARTLRSFIDSYQRPPEMHSKEHNTDSTRDSLA